jgi:RNA polymerase sigma factor (sigma-70 family)
MHQDADDLSLVRAYRDGDVAAFDRLFTRYHTRIRGLCTRYVGDGQLAEDLVQETFFNVLRTLGRVEAGFNFSAWIHRIAVNLCHDELRRRERHRRHVEPAGEILDDLLLQIADHDRRVHPEAALELTRIRRTVWEVAKRLPERQRMVLTLRELQGLSYASIGRVMGISQSAVETLLHRARKRFKEEYLAAEAGAAAENGTCAVAQQLLERSTSRRLGVRQRRLLVQHLSECAGCRDLIPIQVTAVSSAAGAGAAP